MTFARRVFLGAGVFGMAILTPMYFLFDAIGRQNESPITYPQFYYGFLAVTIAWQLAFLVIGSDPVRFRPLMIPSMVEKFYTVLSMAALFVQGRIALTDMIVISPDLALGILFVIAFAKTSAAVTIGYARTWQ
jgi:hypothetical protein